VETITVWCANTTLITTTAISPASNYSCMVTVVNPNFNLFNPMTFIASFCNATQTISVPRKYDKKKLNQK
jgi:hypothetical protein